MKRLIVAELWNEFSRKVLPADAPVIQRQEMRRAFYAGAGGLLKAIEKCLDPGADATDGDLTMMIGISNELTAFVKDIRDGRA